LIEAGYNDPDLFLRHIQKSFLKALEKRNYSIAEMLIEAGAQFPENGIDDKNMTQFLWEASNDARVRLVQLLLDAGAAVVLSKGISTGRYCTSHIMLQLVNNVRNWPGRSEDYINIIEILIKAGANMNYATRDRKTVLQTALCYRAPLVLVSKLVELGADLTHVDEFHDLVL
jgi:ankyrin repeat protein